MKKLMVVMVFVLAGTAYFAGWWREHQPRVAREAELAAARSQLELAEARVRLAALLGDQIALMEAVSERNFGQAQELSSRFFDAVREELTRVSQPEQRSVLEAILRARDSITVALTRGDAEALELLRRIQVRLRTLLGYPTVPRPTVLPETPAASPLPSPVPSATPDAGPTSHPPA